MGITGRIVRFWTNSVAIRGIFLAKAVIMEDMKDEKRFIDDPGAMMAMHPNMSRWIQPVIITLGFWLLTSPLVFNYKITAMLWSDLIAGLLMILISIFSLLFPKQSWMTYGNAFVGVWLLLAPLIFWAPNAAVYTNDTLIGLFLITFSFVIPMSMKMPGPDVPRGWSYNPSTWIQRAPIIVLGLIGFFLSRPMAGYQLGYVDWIWEPFFGEGTKSVLTSEISKAFPVSDAGLGAATYLIEVLSTFMGDQRRWRTMPWMVAMFGMAVIPLGVTSIILVIMQPVMVGAWCTLCLITAASMLIMVPLALDEVVAMVQFLNQSRKEGKSVWRTFWRGGIVSGVTEEPRMDRKEAWKIPPMIWGVTSSWNLILSIAIGIWIMASPDILGGPKDLADSNYLTGALVVTFSFIALSEVGRVTRFFNLFAGLWLAVGSWFLGPYETLTWSAVLMGALLIPLSIPLGKIRDSYGTFDKWVTWPPQKKA